MLAWGTSRFKAAKMQQKKKQLHIQNKYITFFLWFQITCILEKMYQLNRGVYK